MLEVETTTFLGRPVEDARPVKSVLDASTTGKRVRHVEEAREARPTLLRETKEPRVVATAHARAVTGVLEAEVSGLRRAPTLPTRLEATMLDESSVIGRALLTAVARETVLRTNGDTGRAVDALEARPEARIELATAATARTRPMEPALSANAVTVPPPPLIRLNSKLIRMP